MKLKVRKDRLNIREIQEKNKPPEFLKVYEFKF